MVHQGQNAQRDAAESRPYPIAPTEYHERGGIEDKHRGTTYGLLGQSVLSPFDQILCSVLPRSLMPGEDEKPEKPRRTDRDSVKARQGLDDILRRWS